MTFKFVATPRDGTPAPLGIAFECTDYYGCSNLVFADEISEPDQAAVGAAFWTLLLSEPRELADFRDRAYHVGAGFWMEFGCASGELQYSESPG